MVRSLVLLLILSRAAAFCYGTTTDSLEAYKSVPLHFIRNEGQLNPDIRFYEKSAGHSTLFTADGMFLNFFDGRKGAKPPSVRFFPLEGSKSVEITAEGEQKALVNYFVGNDRSKWKTNVQTYKSVVYRNIFDKVDLKFYGTYSQMEYDLIVKPGADLSSLKFGLEGIHGLHIDKSGDLVMELEQGSLIQRKPILYQEINGQRVKREGEFRLLKGAPDYAFSFKVGDYDHKYPLVIDPILLYYSTFLGGFLFESGTSIVTDGSGNVYVAGWTWEEEFPVVAEYDSDCGGEPCSDVFISKINTNESGTASLVYSTFFGGSGKEGVGKITADDNGIIYFTGSTESNDFPLVGAYDATCNNDGLCVPQSGDAYIAILDTTVPGPTALLYSTYLGGGGDDVGDGLALDDSGTLYVSGITGSLDFPMKGAFDTECGTNFDCNGKTDAFVSKIDTNLSGPDSLVYSTYLGGNDYERVAELDIDDSGLVYIAGYTHSTNFPFRGGFQAECGGGPDGCIDAYLAKLDTSVPGDAALLYATYLGGNGADNGRSISVDSERSVYLMGGTTSDDLPLRNGFDMNYNGGGDAFVARFDTTFSGAASLTYATYVGGSEWDSGYAIATDGTGNVYMIGETISNDFPVVAAFDPHCDSMDSCFQIKEDAFVTRLDTNISGKRALVYSTFLGGSSRDFGYAIDIDSVGNAFVTGATHSGDFPLVNEYDSDPDRPEPLSSQTTTDVFVVRIDGFLMREDFTDGISDWTFKKGMWLESGGALTGTGFPTAKAQAPVEWPPSSVTGCTSCTFEVDVSIAGGALSKVILEAWYENSSNTVDLLIKPDTGQIILKQKADGALVNKAKAAFSFLPDTIYAIALRYDGSDIHLSIDGAEILTMAAKAPPHGSLAFKIKNTLVSISRLEVN